MKDFIKSLQSEVQRLQVSFPSNNQDLSNDFNMQLIMAGVTPKPTVVFPAETNTKNTCPECATTQLRKMAQ